MGNGESMTMVVRERRRNFDCMYRHLFSDADSYCCLQQKGPSWRSPKARDEFRKEKRTEKDISGKKTKNRWKKRVASSWNSIAWS